LDHTAFIWTMRHLFKQYSIIQTMRHLFGQYSISSNMCFDFLYDFFLKQFFAVKKNSAS
jgi:hypothetical protein